MMGGMEVLGSRILLRPKQLHRSHRFYRDTLGLAIYREFGGDDAPGIVFFLGSGLLEVSGRATNQPGDAYRAVDAGLGHWSRAPTPDGRRGDGPQRASPGSLGPRWLIRFVECC
jgi:hypothetical protein